MEKKRENENIKNVHICSIQHKHIPDKQWLHLLREQNLCEDENKPSFYQNDHCNSDTMAM